MYCPYCGTKLEDDQLFCHKCGESQVFEEDEEELLPAQQDPAAPLNNGAQAEAEALIASPADAEISAPAASDAAAQVTAAADAAVSEEKQSSPKKAAAAPSASRAKAKTAPSGNKAAKQQSKQSAKNVSKQASAQLKKGVDYIKHMGLRQLIVCCVSVVAVILVAVIVIGAVVKAKEQHLLAVVSDDLVYYVNEEATVLELNFNEEDIAFKQGGIPAGSLAQMSNAAVSDKNVLCYLDDYISDSNSWTLKLNDLDEPGTEIRVDSGVYSELLPGSCGQADSFSCEWKMNTSGSVVFYIKDMTEHGGNLYRYSDGENKLVGSNCLSFNISDDGQRVCWIACDLDGAATVLNAAAFNKKGMAEQLDTQFYDVIGFDEKLDAVYYIRNNRDAVNPYSIYVAGLSADKERLVAGVNYVSQTGADGGFFYSIAESSSDESLYWHSQSGEENLVTRTCSGIVYTDAEHGVAVYYSESLTERTYYLFAEGKSVDFGSMWAVEAVTDNEGENIYLILLEEGVGRSLYHCALSSNGIEKPQCISQRCSEMLMDEAGNTLFYAVYSDENTERSSLYMWSEGQSHLLADDAYPMVVFDGDESWAFFTDVSSAKYTEEGPHLASGTLNIYCDGNVTEIDDDVAMLYWHFGEHGSIVYIKDYLDTFGGTLYVAVPGKGSEKLAIDVQAVLSERKCLDTFGR